MRFSTGQVVVHPHHGPASVAGTFSRTVAGKEVHYVQLTVDHKDLELSVPVAKAKELGIRPPMSTRQVKRMFDRLVAPSGHQETQWSRRVKHNVDRLNSGDALTVAELVRDLTRREADQGLSLGERDLLRDARRPVVDELGIVLGLSEDDTVAVLEAAVLEGVRPDLSRLGDAGLAKAS